MATLIFHSYKEKGKPHSVLQLVLHKTVSFTNRDNVPRTVLHATRIKFNNRKRDKKEMGEVGFYQM